MVAAQGVGCYNIHPLSTSLYAKSICGGGNRSLPRRSIIILQEGQGRMASGVGGSSTVILGAAPPGIRRCQEAGQVRLMCLRCSLQMECSSDFWCC